MTARPQGSPHAPADATDPRPVVPGGAPPHPRLGANFGWRQNIDLRDPDPGVAADPRLIDGDATVLWNGLTLQDDPRFRANPEAPIPDWFDVHITVSLGGLRGFIYHPNSPAGAPPGGNFSIAAAGGTVRLVVPRTCRIRAYPIAAPAAHVVATVAVIPAAGPEVTEGVYMQGWAGPVAVAALGPAQGSVRSWFFSDTANVTLTMTAGIAPAIPLVPVPAAAPPLDLGALPPMTTLLAAGPAVAWNVVAHHRVRLPW